MFVGSEFFLVREVRGADDAVVDGVDGGASCCC